VIWSQLPRRGKRKRRLRVGSVAVADDVNHSNVCCNHGPKITVRPRRALRNALQPNLFRTHQIFGSEIPLPTNVRRPAARPQPSGSSPLLQRCGPSVKAVTKKLYFDSKGSHIATCARRWDYPTTGRGIARPSVAHRHADHHPHREVGVLVQDARYSVPLARSHLDALEPRYPEGRELGYRHRGRGRRRRYPGPKPATTDRCTRAEVAEIHI
jgi:hypothetical protein